MLHDRPNSKGKLKALQGQLSDVHAIRLHRAISWMNATDGQCFATC
jgi:hypothetical protein